MQNSHNKQQSLLARAMYNIFIDDFEQAQTLLRELLDINPNHAEAHYQMARIAAGQKDFVRALLHTQAQSKVEKATFRVHFNLGILYFRTAIDFTLALYNLQIAEILCDREPLPQEKHVCTLYMTLGTLYLRMGNLSKAHEAFTKAHELEKANQFVEDSLRIIAHRMGANLLPEHKAT